MSPFRGEVVPVICPQGDCRDQCNRTSCGKVKKQKILNYTDYGYWNTDSRFIVQQHTVQYVLRVLCAVCCVLCVLCVVCCVLCVVCCVLVSCLQSRGRLL